MGTILNTKELYTGYKGKREKNISGNLNLSLNTSEVVCLLAPNGQGKTTLLKTLAGFLPPLEGDVYIRDRSLQHLSAAKRAKLLSVVLTEKLQASNMTVYGLVTLGRSPYTGWWGAFGNQDIREVKEAISEMHLEPLQHRSLSTLSDGERQKAMIARALAQDTPLIMLDEPTAHLDLPNRVEIMQRLKRLAHVKEKSILITTHDLDLALQTADRLWLIMPDGAVKSGVPEDLILDGSFEKAFHFDQTIFERSTGRFLVTGDACGKIEVQGDHESIFWAKKALQRIGLQTTNEQLGARLSIATDSGLFLLEHGTGSWELSSIEVLLQTILKNKVWEEL